MSKLISGANISNYPKPHGSGATGSSTVIYKGGGGGNDSSFDPSNCRVTKLTANIASIDSITAKNANINNASILYLMSTEGQIAKISGEELNYNYGTINHLTSDEVTTNALTVKDSATIAKLIADYIQSNEITTDYLTVTKSAHFFELIIDKIRSVQGTQMNTAANCTIDYVEAYNSGNQKVNITSNNIAYFRVYWKNTDDDGKSISNDWLPLDQAICESFNVNTGVSYDVSNKYYWRKVIATDGGTPKYVNLNTQEVRNSAPSNYTITFNSSYLFCYGDRSTDTNYQAFTVTSQVLNEYNATSYTWTPSSTLYGLQITPTDQNAMLMNNSFSFHTTAKTKLNIGVYYGDNSFEYFPASDYATEYSITTQENKPVEAFVITTAVIDTWNACNWIDLSNTVMDATKAGKSAIPSAGDVLCQLGYRYTELSGYENTDAWRTAHRDEVSRASAIIIAAYETPDNGDAEHGIPAVFPPSYAQYQNIIDFNLTSHRGTYFDATGAYFKGNLVAGTTVDEGVDLPITVDQWSFVGSPIIIRNDNGTFTPSTITLKILYTSGSSSIIYNSIPSGTHLYVNGAQVNTLTIASANMLNVELKDNDGKTLCATVINANDIDVLADVHDGVDGDFYEWIYQEAGIDEELVNADLPQSLEKKFYLYTTSEKRSWSQTPPTIDPESENLWMSQRFVRNTVIESPIIIVDKERIVYQTTPNNSVTATVRVTGSNLASNVTVTLTNQSNVFRVSSNSLDYEDVNDEGVTLTVTFAPTTTGNYEGSISLSSTGSNTISIPLTGKSSTGDNASNNYLNVKNNNTISTVGWDATKVDNLYAYNEIPDLGIAWLTMPVYGAFSALHENYTQNWLSTDVTFDTSVAITTGGWQPMADNVFLGSDYYFTNTTAKSVGTGGIPSESVSFTVTNITAARLLGYNSDNASSTYPMTMTIYECTVSGGTVTPSSTPIYNPNGTNPNPSALVYLYIDNLDPNKVYRIVCNENRGTLYEVAFATPITKIADAESPSGRDVVTTWGAWSTPIQINGENGEKGADGPGVEFIYHLTRDNLPAPNLWQYRNQITNYSSLSSSYIGYDASDNYRISWWQEDNNSPIHNSSYVDYIPPSYTYSYQGLNYLRTGWTDDPQGVNSSYMYEWVSQRKSRDGVWGDFSTPVVWAKWGENGVDGVDGIDGIDGIDGENAEEWKLIPVKKTFEVNINKDVANNYESITGVIKTDLAFAVLHIDGETATYLTYNELGSYNLKLLTNNTTGNKSQNLGSNRATVTLADGTSLACLVYNNSNYLTYTSGQSSGDVVDYYYLHKHNETSRMPTQMIVKLMKGSSQMDATTLDLIFAPDHIFSVTDDALNSVYQGLSGDTLGSFTTGFSAIRQQWDGINLNVSNIQNISNGSWPQNTEYEQYAFYRNNANVAPSAPSGNVTVTSTSVNNTWTLGHITPSSTNKYVWYTKRTKPATSYSHATDNWSSWGTVTLFQIYGSDRGYINSAALNIKADSITSTVSQTYQTKTDAQNSYTALDSKIDQTATSITSTVSATYQTKTDATNSYNSLNTKIDQTATDITSTVSQTYETKSDANNQYDELSTTIQQTADSISLYVNRTTGNNLIHATSFSGTESVLGNNTAWDWSGGSHNSGYKVNGVWTTDKWQSWYLALSANIDVNSSAATTLGSVTNYIYYVSTDYSYLGMQPCCFSSNHLPAANSQGGSPNITLATTIPVEYIKDDGLSQLYTLSIYVKRITDGHSHFFLGVGVNSGTSITISDYTNNGGRTDEENVTIVGSSLSASTAYVSFNVNDTNVWHRLFITFRRDSTSTTFLPQFRLYRNTSGTSNGANWHVVMPQLNKGSLQPFNLGIKNGAEYGSLKQTGIDITEGKITLNADNTIINGNLNVRAGLFYAQTYPVPNDIMPHSSSSATRTLVIDPTISNGNYIVDPNDNQKYSIPPATMYLFKDIPLGSSSATYTTLLVLPKAADYDGLELSVFNLNTRNGYNDSQTQLKIKVRDDNYLYAPTGVNSIFKVISYNDSGKFYVLNQSLLSGSSFNGPYNLRSYGGKYSKGTMGDTLLMSTNVFYKFKAIGGDWYVIDGIFTGD